MAHVKMRSTRNGAGSANQSATKEGHQNGITTYFNPQALPAEKDSFEREKMINQKKDQNNNNELSEGEDFFLDTSTQSKSHPRADSEEPVQVFSEKARDQFAAALLRLQSQLDSSSQRLSAIEAKLESLSRSCSQQLARKQQSPPKGIFKRANLLKLAYFSWPVVVFVLFRALERRRLASGSSVSN